MSKLLQFNKNVGYNDISLLEMDVMVHAFAAFLRHLKDKENTFLHVGNGSVSIPRPFAYKLIYLYIRRWIQQLDYLVDECNWLYDSFLSDVLWMSVVEVADVMYLDMLYNCGCLDKTQNHPDDYFIQSLLNVAFERYLFCLTTFESDEECQVAIRQGNVDNIFGSIPTDKVTALKEMSYNERAEVLAKYIDAQGMDFVHTWEQTIREVYLGEVSCIFADRDWEFKSAWNQEFDPEHCMQMGIDPSYFDNPDLNAVSEEEGEYYRDVSLKIITMYWEIRAKEYEQ